MITIKTQIKANGWHEIEIVDGVLIKGDTIRCKEFIKKYLDGKWSAKDNGWIVNAEKVTKYTTEAGTIMVR